MNVVDFGADIFSSVDLDFKDVVFLLSQVGQQVHLSVDNSSDTGTVFSDSVELDFNFFGLFGNFTVIVGESFLFGVHPVLVESSEGSLVQMIGPNGGKGSKSSWGFNVTNQTDNL